MPAISKVILFIARVQTGHKLFETFAKYLERKLMIDKQHKTFEKFSSGDEIFEDVTCH